MKDQMFQEILEGLEAPPKSIPSKYFQENPEVDPFHLDEYYFNRCEKEILSQYASEIARAVPAEEFNLIELGADPGGKSYVLISEFLKKKNFFNHYTIDPHAKSLEQTAKGLEENFPSLFAHGVKATALTGLHSIAQINTKKKVLLLLGSQLSQRSPEEMMGFMQGLRSQLQSKELVLVGFPMKFIDQASAKAAHHLKILSQFNQDLMTDFDPSQYKYIEVYNDMPATSEGFLVSTQNQKVHFTEYSREVEISKNELIQTEATALLSEEEIRLLMQKTGFKVEKFFYDNEKNFADVLIIAS